MKVFLSHAISDRNLIENLRIKCSSVGLQLLIAEHYVSVKETITDKIEAMIKDSQIALFLLTEKGSNSDFVKHEIGWVKGLNKPALYIVEKGQKITGLVYGKDYIQLDPNEPGLAIDKAIKRLISHWNELIAIENEQSKKVGWFFVSLIGLALLTTRD